MQYNDLIFIVHEAHYGDIIKPLATQPLNNRHKKTENAKLRQKNSQRYSSRLFYNKQTNKLYLNFLRC